MSSESETEGLRVREEWQRVLLQEPELCGCSGPTVPAAKLPGIAEQAPEKLNF